MMKRPDKITQSIIRLSNINLDIGTLHLCGYDNYCHNDLKKEIQLEQSDYGFNEYPNLEKSGDIDTVISYITYLENIIKENKISVDLNQYKHL